MFFELTIWDIAAISVKLTIYVCCFVTSGSILFSLLNPTLDRGIESGLLRLILTLSALVIVASSIQIGVQAGRLLDEGIIGMLDPEMVALVLDTSLGEAVAVRIIGTVFAVAFALSMTAGRFFGGLASVMISASFALVGHGTEEPRWLMTSLVTAHLLAVSFWIGALWPLRKAADGTLEIQKAGELAHHFGKQAVVIVPILLIAGGVLTYQLVGSIGQIFGSQYGLTLLLKLSLVAVLLTLAAANKFRFVPAMLEGDASGGANLRRSINFEGFVFLTIFVVTAVLTTITALPE